MSEIRITEEIPTIANIAEGKKKKLLAAVRRLYFVEKWTIQDIAVGLNVSETIVRRYINVIKRYGRSVVRKWEEYRDEMVNFLFELFERHNQRVNKLWNEYKKLSDKDVKNKLDIFTQLREEDRYILSVLKEFGLTKEATDKSLNAGIVYVSFKDQQPTDTTAVEVKD